MLLAAAALLASCARTVSTDTNALEAQALSAYMEKYYSGAYEKTTMGAYIFTSDEVPGTGTEYGDSAYIRVDYTTTDRDGRFVNSTLEGLNKKNHNYNSRNYYGPVVMYCAEDALKAGVEELLMGTGTSLGPMKVGGTRRALVPGWLMTTSRHSSEADYIKKVSGTEAIYEVTLVDTFADEERWETDSLARYIAANYPDAVKDTVLAGWYYVVTKAADTGLLAADSTVYVNYTLRDLSGRVIDSNVEKVARDNDFYSSSSKYVPALINWNSDYRKITMTSSETDVVDGFANAFLHMHQYESGIALFWSGLGYYYSGSGSSIPAYCPLRFDLELTVAP